jgi:hypothetical protein
MFDKQFYPAHSPSRNVFSAHERTQLLKFSWTNSDMALAALVGYNRQKAIHF